MAVARGGFGLGKHSLQLKRCAHGIERIGEHGMDAVTAHLHDRAAVFLYSIPSDRVMASQRRAHFVRLGLPQACAALDVRKEVRRDCGSVVHPGSLQR
jgi:hypothetical protein